MIRSGRLDLSPTNRRAVVSDGHVRLHKTMVLGPDPERALTPSGFLIEQPAGATIRPHFHVNCQWQVFVGGSGWLGRKPVQAFVAQYVAAHTGYGPIVAGEDGLWYMTLRPSAPSGAQYLPDSRDRLDMALPKLSVTSDHVPPDLAAQGSTVAAVVVPQPNGLAAWMVQLESRQCIDAPVHPGGLARYYVVTHGDMVVGDYSLGPLSLAWVDGEDLTMPLHAGPAGLGVLCLQFPGDAIF